MIEKDKINCAVFVASTVKSIAARYMFL